MDNKMTDIVTRLRTWVHAVDALPASDLMDEAADEIARLRLTGAEREAVRFFSQIDGPGNVPVANIRAAALRGLLERLK